MLVVHTGPIEDVFDACDMIEGRLYDSPEITVLCGYSFMDKFRGRKPISHVERFDP
ncbi:MAG: hypothetical protein HY880_02930, partial [Deltaproteobacteria bacterium]|nr:hypothetical protein [Deltaproteobacteria bacterium]